jgi:hypothetical protein
MRKLFLLYFFLLSGFIGSAQFAFKTIVPQGPFVAGESFRVQYVVENSEHLTNLLPPAFKGFRLVNGPETYSGQSTFLGRTRPLKNSIYTLQAIKPGKFLIPGAVATINGKNLKSNDVWILVITEKEAQKLRFENGHADDNNPGFLKPGDDPYQKIRENLFLKVMVDKKICFTGQPVVATFKLYSRLQSKSDIVKNPGFYGFTVQDMINLEDKLVTVEKINGKLFDVHTIRQVQLYPLQSGTYTIDPMEINNRVSFSKSAVNKKPEQEIVEGVFENRDETGLDDTEVFDSNMRTSPVTIHVKPAPPAGKPDDFNGATGRFTIKAQMEKNEVAKNEEGYLVVTISGEGNFTQLSAPRIDWPSGIEGFDPRVVERLDKMSAPISGSKSFRYAFVSTNPGIYDLPSIKLSYFDPDTNKYHTVSSPVAHVAVTAEEKIVKAPLPGTQTSLKGINQKVSLIAAGIVVLAGLSFVIYWAMQKKTRMVIHPDQFQQPVVQLPTVDEILKPAYLLIPAADKDFYGVLRHSIWEFLGQRFGLTGSMMNKNLLKQQIETQTAGEKQAGPLLDILDQCEAGIFTNASLSGNKEELLLKVRTELESLSA